MSSGGEGQLYQHPILAVKICSVWLSLSAGAVICSHIDPLFHKCSFRTQIPSPEHPMTEVLFVLLPMWIARQKSNSFYKTCPDFQISTSEFSHIYQEDSNAMGRTGEEALICSQKQVWVFELNLEINVFFQWALKHVPTTTLSFLCYLNILLSH